MVLICLVFFCGCTSTEVKVPPPVSANNSAILEGENLGTQTASNSVLRKEVVVEVRVPNSSFKLGKAYLTRSTKSSESFYWVVAVTNTSSQIKCFVEAKDIQLLNDSGTVLVNQAFTFLTGQVGISQNRIYTDTCLAAGETSYILGIELDLFANVAKISLGLLDSLNSSFSLSSAKIIPQSYAIGQSGLLRDFSATVKHMSNGAVKIGLFSKFFLLDQSDEPLIFGFLSPPTGDELINSGEIKTLQDSSRLSPKAASTITIKGITRSATTL